MKQSRKFFYFFQIFGGILFMWTSGLLRGENLWLNAVSPVLYGNELRISVAGWGERIVDGLIGSWMPRWMVEKNQMSYDSLDSDELYPSDSLLAAIYAENHPEESQAVNAPVASSQGITYTVDKLKDYNYFVNQFYAIDSTTYASDGLLDAESFINMDLTMDLTGDEPKILIYHTHSQEAFLDSRSGEAADTVVGVGEVLKKNLEERYGIATVHLTDTFDVIDGVTDRSAAYTYAEEGVRAVLEEYPSIKVIIDIHRDGVADETRLVTNINGQETAQIMFLNGLCRTAANGPIEYLQNPYLSENLAFSFKLQAKAAQYYPEFTRRIYLRSYQYNLHILPRSLLVECGAQTNTVEEVKNAMPLLADLLYLVLSGN
ncbi:MAG: stage II sporulation protein P [Lachnospiraceae bacterium]|nr:stage II sporulation protein P [Lachnospiraceae bacterium]